MRRRSSASRWPPECPARSARSSSWCTASALETDVTSSPANRRAVRHRPRLQAAERRRSRHRRRRLQRRRLPHPRQDKGEYAGGLELRFEGRSPSRARHPQHEAAGRPAGFSLLILISRRVPADPARLRLHADRRRRAARAQPHRRSSTRCAPACATARSTACCSRPTWSRTRRGSSATSSACSRRWTAASWSGRWRSSAGARRRSSASRSGSSSRCRAPPSRLLGVLRVALPAEDVAARQAAGQLPRHRRFREGPAPVRRLALRVARARLHADRRHGGALLLGRQRELPAHASAASIPAYTPPPMKLGRCSSRLSIVIFAGNR